MSIKNFGEEFDRKLRRGDPSLIELAERYGLDLDRPISEKELRRLQFCEDWVDEHGASIIGKNRAEKVARTMSELLQGRIRAAIKEGL